MDLREQRDMSNHLTHFLAPTDSLARPIERVQIPSRRRDWTGRGCVLLHYLLRSILV